MNGIFKALADYFQTLSAWQAGVLIVAIILAYQSPKLLREVLRHRRESRKIHSDIAIKHAKLEANLRLKAIALGNQKPKRP